MKLKRTPISKLLLALLPALLLALVLQPAVAIAEQHTITYYAGAGGSFSPTVLVSKWTNQVGHGGCDTNPPQPYSTTAGKTFDCYTADVEVTLNDSATNPTVIPKGTPITFDQVKQVIVNSDITYTGYYIQLRTITYKVEGNGSIDTTSEQVKNAHTPEKGSTPTADYGYQFVYWTSSIGMWTADGITYYDTGEHIPGNALMQLVISANVTLTAHFEPKYYIVEYATAGNGSVLPMTEHVQEGYLPTAKLTFTPDKNYTFDYWTANVDVELEEAASNAATTIKKGDPITEEQRTQIKLTSDLRLTAHFKQTGTDPEPSDPDNPDGSGTIKPANGSDSKLTPKTADALPAATTAVLCAGGVLVATTVLVRKRCH